MPMTKDLYVIIPAAGRGLRMGEGETKLFLPVNGVPVLGRTLHAFSSYARKKEGMIRMHIVIVTSSELIERVKNLVEENQFTFVESIVLGGETRQDSVQNGAIKLKELHSPPTKEDVVFIHDGARCLVDFNTLDRCFSDTAKYGVCVAAVPVKDTIKEVVEKGQSKVKETLDRGKLHAIQTPQAFLWEILEKSLKNAAENEITGTDDTSLAEAMGYPVFLTPGSYQNIKITTPEDILIAEAFLRAD